ncbi:MAG: hypothetical protein ACTSQ9_07865 [Candidatus Hodarchaeales archaeon]
MKLFSNEIYFQKRMTTVIGKDAFILRLIFLIFGFMTVGFIFLLNGVDPLGLFLTSSRSMLRIILILLPNAFVSFIPLSGISHPL